MVALCDSADEELRHVAIETLLTFGKDHIYRRTDCLVLSMSYHNHLSFSCGLYLLGNKFNYKI